MKIVKKAETKTNKNSDTCVAIEYPLKDNDINGAVIELDGRYPEKGRVANLKCKELAFIIEGSGRVVVEGKEEKVGEGDLILIEPGEKFFWEGNLTMFVPCIPPWSRDQYEEFE